MITFDILTIFPGLFDPFKSESLLKKAQEKNLLKIGVYNLRDWSEGPHRSVDDKPFGGGLGMVMKVEPVFKAIQELKQKGKTKVILFTPRGKKFNQQKAFEYAKLDQIVMICGRYEGVDERVAKYIADEQVSLGDYVLMGGEVPAMVVIESVARLIPGVVGKPEFVPQHERARKKGKGFIEYPEYTRPEVFSPEPGVNWKAPKVLLSGNHKKIEEWKEKHGKVVGK